MTSQQFKDLCRADFRVQLEKAGYEAKYIEYRIENEEPFFEKSKAYMSDIGGCLGMQGDTTAYLYYIMVYEGMRGKGYGKKLLIHFENQMKKKGMTKIMLNVYAHNTVGKKLYKDYKEITTLMEKSL